MKHFSIIAISGDNEDFDAKDTNYAEVVANQLDIQSNDNKVELLEYFFKGVNGDEFSDFNWYFLVDNAKEEIILFD